MSGDYRCERAGTVLRLSGDYRCKIIKKADLFDHLLRARHFLIALECVVLFIPQNNPMDVGYPDDPCFIAEEAEAHQGQVTCSRPQ